ncbi:ExbD/TolR family protein [Sedimentimonas flavescens]|uniref:ExbD/TolR family protein n=1 Tax=Sedimentimonas flavescens TaxID=2851012 RepID=A0ABT2ZUC1_9RHOB|nr:ExbD/TolR family protein [Sedimentimonas flavescens]MBW0156889.1 ExbD/TolR family protein [Sedimentimonas flavescens]MCT2539381.1 ExbD/TolR family protein [Sedimentimonas flavescens]MCV2877339.1 ExbD/TolR family protein [Sedimentimonas flavescens]WBL32635.1 ExbD/TolR family protein [Sinirhodobacter sp. HNIBRBA609]
MGAGVIKRGGGGGRKRRGKHSKHAAMSEINVTPMVDVMLVLLIIFMVAAPMMTVGVPLELPKTAAKAVPTEQEEPLTISLQLDGTVSMMNTPVPETELVDRLRAVAQERDSDKVFLRADGGIEYARVVQVMGALNAGGFSNIVLVTDTGGPGLTGTQAGN